MTDLFADKADDWDTRPVPAQISAGVFDALQQQIALSEELTVMDFGAGTGLISTRIAPQVDRILAVDISESMLEKLAQKPELEGKVQICCQDILERPLDEQVQLIVSAMALHHVEDTRALLGAFQNHLLPGGRIALADLDTEPGSFHPPDMEGVYHHGFDRDELGTLLEETGFVDVEFVTACVVDKEDARYPVFLVTATRS